MFYRFSSHFIIKLILLKFYFLENTEGALKSFSPFNPTKSPYKIVLFKNLNLAPSFPLTKNAKKGFSSNPPPKKEGSKKKALKERVQKERVQKERLQKESFRKSFKKREFKKKGFKKESSKKEKP
ncbi:hypothetical protein AOH178_08620 [Helicobacter pylori]